jgi:hypothetical protein
VDNVYLLVVPWRETTPEGRAGKVYDKQGEGLFGVVLTTDL